MPSAHPHPEELARKLLAWFGSEQRSLPWRSTKDPWAIWVSEVMLQQTRVATVREAWPRFLERFPDAGSLARAGEDEVLAAWKGLGYYRRARLLQEAARILVREFEGKVPRDPEALSRLPGVGPYTKGALGSIAFGLPLPAVDGNVERVVSRFLALEGNPRRKEGRTRIREALSSMMGSGRPGDLNQALMDLGSTLCLPKSPRCRDCPLEADCLARKEGRPGAYPLLPTRPRPVQARTKVALAWRGDTWLCRRIPGGEVNQGQLCLPGLGLPLPGEGELPGHLFREHGLRLQRIGLLGTLEHSITKYRITVEVHAFEAPPRSRPGRGLAFEDPKDESLPWSTLVRKVRRLLEETGDLGGRG